KVPLVTLFEVARHMGALPPEFANWVALNGSSAVDAVQTDSDKTPETTAPDGASKDAKPSTGTPPAVKTDLKTEDLKISGTASGSAKYNRRTGVAGTFALHELSFALPQRAPLQISSTSIKIDGENVHMPATQVDFGENQTAEVEFNSSLATPRALDLKLTTRNLSLDATHSLGLPAISFAKSVAGAKQSGTWKGWARYRVGSLPTDVTRVDSNKASDPEPTVSAAGAWSSEAELQNCRIAIDGIADPVEILAASVKLDARRILFSRIRGKAGKVAFTGSFRADLPTDPSAPDAKLAAKSNANLDLVIHDASASELERLLSPALARGRGGLLARTLRLGAVAPPPFWLKSRSLKASVLIETLTIPLDPDPGKLDEWKIVSLRGQLDWDGPKIHVSEITGGIDPALMYGDLDVDISAPSPKYQYTGSLIGIPFHGGAVDLAGTVASEGNGIELLANALGEGSVQGHSIAFAPDAEFRSISGAFELKPTPGTRWKLTNVEATPATIANVPAGPTGGTAASTTVTGTGASQEDGHLVLDLVRGDRTSHYVGTLFPTAK
ncbi:MAG: hypothetical protein ABI824_05845, partial [Acidobacteriota bacterium]